MYFFNAQSSPLNLTRPLHDLPKNLEKFCPWFIYGESRTAEDHIKIFKEICNRNQIQHMDVVCHLFPYTLGEMAFNWYLNLPPASIRDWNYFERNFLEQFKIYVDPTLLYHQFISIKRDPHETISQFNHRFYRMYQRMEFPYTIPQEATI